MHINFIDASSGPAIRSAPEHLSDYHINQGPVNSDFSGQICHVTA